MCQRIFSMCWWLLPPYSDFRWFECNVMWRKNFVVCNHTFVHHISNLVCYLYNDNLHNCCFIIREVACNLFTFNTYSHILAISNHKYFLFNDFDNSPLLSLLVRVWWSWSTPIQENFIYKKQGPSPISLVRATRIFLKLKH